MMPTDDDRLAELAARHYVGEYTPGVAKRLDEIMSMPDGNVEVAKQALLNAANHLGVDGSKLEEVVARVPEAKA